MHLIDWVIVCGFVVMSVTVAMLHGRKSGESSEEFFVAGRSLGWFMAGTSMVATTFSSDTPLFVAGAVRRYGIASNWIWWSAAIGTLASIFFFARLWRRTEATTEVELIYLRYGAAPVANGLRVFKAIVDGVLMNCLIMASVTLAIGKLATVIMGLSGATLFTLPLIGGVSSVTLVVSVLGCVAVTYSTLSGFSGVVWSDALQFLFAMTGAIALAVITCLDLSAHGGYQAALHQIAAQKPGALDFFPAPAADLPFVTFLILITISWLPTAPGTGFFLQRVLASRSERDAALGFAWFAFCHYVLRSWPWIVVGLASLIYFPVIADAESAYPAMINLLLPIGLKGIMVASLQAAFMSCTTSQLNWGSSYIVNDVYEPFIAPGRERRHYVKIGRLAMIGLAVVTAIVLPFLTGILAAYKYLGVIMVGSTPALILRWYWWRITAVAEIVGVVSAIVLGNALFFIVPDRGADDLFAIRMLINLVGCGVLTIIAALITSRAGPTSQVIEFYRKTRIRGKGWARVRAIAQVEPLDAGMRESVTAWLGSIGLLYGLLFGVGYAIFGNWASSLGWFVAALVGGLVLRNSGFTLGDSTQSD